MPALILKKKKRLFVDACDNHFQLNGDVYGVGWEECVVVVEVEVEVVGLGLGQVLSVFVKH